MSDDTLIYIDGPPLHPERLTTRAGADRRSQHAADIVADEKVPKTKRDICKEQLSEIGHKAVKRTAKTGIDVA